MNLSQSKMLFERAVNVIPGGIYGHTSPAATVPMEFPYYAKEASGCRYKDVDGNEYIDFLCAYGPVVLGYHHPRVEEAAERQRRMGDCFNHPAPVMVELAERLVNLVDFADWAVFGKNGSDMTTWSIQVAREFTKRKKILCVKGAYHGSHAWCTPGYGGLIEEDKKHIHAFGWNDLEDFHANIKKFRNQIAGVIMTPFHHPMFADSVLPAPGFFEAIETTCRQEGIVFILDDIRAGFRLDLGGSHRFFGFEPDLTCYSKALGNGYPISAALGRKELKIAATKVFLTGSFWNNAVPMAAAMACLDVLEKENAIHHIRKMGEMLAVGFHDLAKKHKLPLRLSGPPALPFLTFADETNFLRSQRFTVECIQRGVFFHPHHNWFLSAAHQPADIQKTLKIADQAFAIVKRHF
ncbi:MAG: aminotransferase class III-fold pyridoxal phosphate-dependent enzyme [Verrucomicrobiota bacterium]